MCTLIIQATPGLPMPPMPTRSTQESPAQATSQARGRCLYPTLKAWKPLRSTPLRRKLRLYTATPRGCIKSKLAITSQGFPFPWLPINTWKVNASPAGLQKQRCMRWHHPSLRSSSASTRLHWKSCLQHLTGLLESHFDPEQWDASTRSCVGSAAG